MRRRDLLRSAVAGLLGAAMPAGLLAGMAAPMGVGAMYTGPDGVLWYMGIDHATEPGSVIELTSTDGGQTWEQAPDVFRQMVDWYSRAGQRWIAG